MLFKSLPADCVLDIVKRLDPYEIRKVKIVNERMRTIVDGYNVDKIIYEIRFSKDCIYVKIEKDSEPFCTQYASITEDQEEWTRVRYLVEQASIIENVCILNWTIAGMDMCQLQHWFGALGISSESMIVSLRFQGPTYEAFTYLSQFLDRLKYEELHLRNVKYEKKFLSNMVFAVKNLRSVHFANRPEGQICCILGKQNVLTLLRQGALQHLDLHCHGTFFTFYLLHDLIKYALDMNLAIYWDFGQIRNISERNHEEIQSLKHSSVNVLFEKVDDGTGKGRYYYTIKSPMSTIKFNATTAKE